MKEDDLAYLSAELQQAQQMGITTTLVRVTELQGLIDRLKALNERPKQPVQMMGYCRPGEIRGLRKGSFGAIRVKRKPNEWYSQAVYFDPPQVYGERTDHEQHEHLPCVLQPEEA